MTENKAVIGGTAQEEAAKSDTLSSNSETVQQTNPQNEEQLDFKNPNGSGWKAIAELDSLPLIKSGYSLEADMKFGWKPQVKGKILPIPLLFDTEDDFIDIGYTDPLTRKKMEDLYHGWRPADSFALHRTLLKNTSSVTGSCYHIKLPNELPISIQKLLDHQMQERIFGG